MNRFSFLTIWRNKGKPFFVRGSAPKPGRNERPGGGMTPFFLDFAPKPSIPRRTLVLLLVLVVVVLVEAEWEEIRPENVGAAARDNGRISLIRAGASTSRQAEIGALNRQIRQLNRSWEGLFEDLHDEPGNQVDLIALDVNAQTGAVRLVALARDTDAMAEFAARLQYKPALFAVRITRHELEAQRVRFMIDAQWTERF